MQYQPLSSIFYSNNSEYFEIYADRYNSESSYRFDFNIKGNNAFLVINHDILQRIETIYTLDRDLLVKMNSLPPIALQQYAKKCLVDEIKMISGVLKSCA